jgi:RPA family protein
MSGSDDGDDGDGGPGRREVAHRLFAAEFDDVTVSYRESDEERAPNYVVLPTGARVNRAFAVGVLTEVESVNESVVRARVADPTGAFVSYAGQYQPEALAFFERTDPPEFVALTGKARTFEPEDGDRVFSSLRPESVNAVDADTRDRWVVDAARATLRRVAVTSDALSRDARGDDLRAALLADGVPEALAAGVPLAIDRYGTTEAYLEDVRRMAVESLELVAGERETVTGLSLAPDEGGAAAVGPTVGGAATDATLSEPTDAGPDAETVEAASEAVERASEPSEPSDSGVAGDAPATTAEADTEPTAESESVDEATAEPAEPDTLDETTESAEPESVDDLGDFETDEFDDDGLYEMDDEEREEAASFGTEFETGTEVDPAGEADIDVPDEPPEPEPEPSGTGADEADADAEADVDLEDAVVAAMQDLDDGSGADREAVVARVVEDHGVDPEAVEEAVQDALMSGRCYEPDETTLQPI